MEYIIRQIAENEHYILTDFLYEAIFIPEGTTPPPKNIINRPELQEYIINFGLRQGDFGVVAEINKKIVGVVWSRIMNDYGHIDDKTPSLAISVYKEYRNLGIGTAMMKEMFSLLKRQGYTQTSLAVQKENHAVKMYTKIGFRTIHENEEEYIMIYKL